MQSHAWSQQTWYGNELLNSGLRSVTNLCHFWDARCLLYVTIFGFFEISFRWIVKSIWKGGLPLSSAEHSWWKIKILYLLDLGCMGALTIACDFKPNCCTAWLPRPRYSVYSESHWVFEQNIWYKRPQNRIVESRRPVFPFIGLWSLWIRKLNAFRRSNRAINRRISFVRLW